MSKINKIESFDLELLLGGVQSRNVVSGNFFYDTSPQHRPHIDLGVNLASGERRDYRLYNPPGGSVFPMNPGQNVTFR